MDILVYCTVILYILIVYTCDTVVQSWILEEASITVTLVKGYVASLLLLTHQQSAECFKRTTLKSTLSVHEIEDPH